MPVSDPLDPDYQEPDNPEVTEGQKVQVEFNLDDLPEKFRKDPTQLVKSYGEAETQLGRLTPEAKLATRFKEQLQEAGFSWDADGTIIPPSNLTQPQAQAATQEQDPLQPQWSYEQDEWETMTPQEQAREWSRHQRDVALYEKTKKLEEDNERMKVAATPVLNERLVEDAWGDLLSRLDQSNPEMATNLEALEGHVFRTVQGMEGTYVRQNPKNALDAAVNQVLGQHTIRAALGKGEPDAQPILPSPRRTSGMRPLTTPRQGVRGGQMAPVTSVYSDKITRTKLSEMARQAGYASLADYEKETANVKEKEAIQMGGGGGYDV